MKTLIRDAQRVYPPQEIIAKQLNLFLDADILYRCRGRLTETEDICAEAANPYFISKNSPLVRMILKDFHLKLKHCGLNTLISEYRQKYWTRKSGGWLDVHYIMILKLNAQNVLSLWQNQRLNRLNHHYQLNE